MKVSAIFFTSLALGTAFGAAHAQETTPYVDFTGQHVDFPDTKNERIITTEIVDTCTLIITHEGYHEDHGMEILWVDRIDLRGMMNAKATDMTYNLDGSATKFSGYFSYKMRAPFVVERTVPLYKAPKPPILRDGPTLGGHSYVIAARTRGGALMQDLDRDDYIFDWVKALTAYQQDTCITVG